MRAVKVSRPFIALIALVFLVINSTAVWADSYGPSSYFENDPHTKFEHSGGGVRVTYDSGATPGLIARGFAGSTTDRAPNGSVMPNWQATGDTSFDGGGGAIGTTALRDAYKANTGKDLNIYDMRERKQALLYLLRDRHLNEKSGDVGSANARAWDRMGSAVVVRTMLGSQFDSPDRDRSRNISEDEWTALQERLVDNDEITMDHEYSNALENSSGVYSQDSSGNIIFDAIRYTYSEHPDVNSWVFRDTAIDSGDNVIYRIEIICANPLGVLPGLPPAPEEAKEYTLTPAASVDKTSAEPGDTVTVTENSVTNSGPDDSRPAEWRLTEMIFEPGSNPGNTDTRDDNNQPCDSFSSAGRRSCDTVAGQSGTDITFPASFTEARAAYPRTIPEDWAVGTRLCFVVSVAPFSASDDPMWRHSRLHCVIIAKSPKMQVWGGDVRVGGDINTSVRSFTSPDPLTHGSWGEYGVLSNGINSGFASGSGLNNGNVIEEQSMWSKLTFANTGTGGSCEFGCYNFTLTSSTLAGQFNASSAPEIGGNVNLNSLASGTYRAGSGNLRLAGNNLPAGRSIVLISEHPVTIDGNITYNNGPYTNIRDIPQVVIRAPLINIQGSVSQVDAWLFAITGDATGALNTCSDVAVDANLSADMCNVPLMINGPVVADKIHLRRTAGSDPDSRGNPAEVFNLRADAYLWGAGYGSGANRVQTVYTKELSPRF